MARPLRIEYPGALYHVTSRGNAREPVYLSDVDRNLFLGILSSTVKRYNLLLYAYCLMENHYHLLIETPEANLSSSMRYLNQIYTQRFNKTHKRVGHLFQGRYKSILVQREKHLLALCRYIVQNPVRAGIVQHPEEYQWSSCRQTASLEPPAEYLSVDWILSQFGQTKSLARKEYRKFISVIQDQGPVGPDKQGVARGSAAFIAKLSEALWEKEDIEEISKRQRYAARPPLNALFPSDGSISKRERNRLIYEAVFDFGYSQKAIADHTGLHYASVSRIVSAQNRTLC